MAWAKWLVVEPTLEQELKLESDCRSILQDQNNEQVAKFCTILQRKTWVQEQIIKQSIAKICELEAKLACLEIKSERPWWRKFLR